MTTEQAIIFQECKDLISSTTEESLLDAIECVSQNDSGYYPGVINLDLTNMIRIARRLSKFPKIKIDEMAETHNNE